MPFAHRTSGAITEEFQGDNNSNISLGSLGHCPRLRSFARSVKETARVVIGQTAPAEQ